MEILKKIGNANQKVTLKSPFKLPLHLLAFLVIFCFSCKKNTENVRLEKGMVITESITVAKDTFKINTDPKSSAIEIQGENIILDFQGAVLIGSNDKIYPNDLYGIGIKVRGENIEIKNVTVHGFRLGLEAINVNGLKINNSEFSYNHRCRNSNDSEICNPLGKNPKKAVRWSAGIKINNCQNIELTDNKITQNSYGVVITKLENGLIANNSITHNSVTGIGSLDIDNLKIVHNFLDWNKKYGFNCPISSQNNIISYNSMTHCGYHNFSQNINFANNLFPIKETNKNKDSLQKIYPPLENGQSTHTTSIPYQGKKYILNDEWGPYNFQYPAIWLREINDDKYTFGIFGPEGNWKIVNGNGFVQSSRQSGSMPATMVATKAKNSEEPLSLDLEFIGVEFIDQFGNRNPRGKTYKFGFTPLEE